MLHRGACHLATLADSRTPNHPSSVSSDPGRFCGGDNAERDEGRGESGPPTEIKRARTTLLSLDNSAHSTFAGGLLEWWLLDFLCSHGR